MTKRKSWGVVLLLIWFTLSAIFISSEGFLIFNLTNIGYRISRVLGIMLSGGICWFIIERISQTSNLINDLFSLTKLIILIFSVAYISPLLTVNFSIDILISMLSVFICWGCINFLVTYLIYRFKL